MIRAAVIAALVAPPFCAAPAAAQNGAVWTDDLGRMVTLEFSGPPAQPVIARDRTPGEMAAAFKKLCVDTQASAEAIAPVAQESGLEPAAFTIPATKKVGPIALQIWRSDGLALAQTDGFFAAPQHQCNAIFYMATLPQDAAVNGALAEALGKQASNAADAFRKDGKPNKRYVAEWVLDGADGGSWTASAIVAQGSRYVPGNRVLISLRASSKKAN